MYKKILVPLDGSKLAECVLPHVESIAKGCGTESITFIRVAEPIRTSASAEEDGFYSGKAWQQMESDSRAAARRYIDQLASRIKYDGINVQTEVLTDKRAGDLIADYATKNEFDLIVIATHGRSGISRWVWGSVTDKILRSACVPVLMVRAPGCVPGI
jgi:nucleotide-binding universal stress UspA family protein